MLSACETATGRLTGNEVMGLVRAFLHAGARSVIATHWKVEDQATAQLMANFARELGRGQSVAQCLTAAQRAFIQMSTDDRGDVGGNKRSIYAHPFYWGAPAFMGVDGVCCAISHRAAGG